MRFYSSILLISWLFSQTGHEIADRISSREAPSDVKSTLIMTLKDKKGNTFKSELISHSKDSGKKQMIWFVSPPSDKGISLYKIENEDGKDLMKMWLPAFKKTRKISSRKKSENFMNSDLTFEDLYNRSLDDFTYEIDSPNDSVYVLTSYPKEELNSNYSKHISWISKSTLLIRREESYSSKGILLKSKEFKYTNIDGFDLVKEINVVDAKTKHETLLRFEDMKLNSGIRDKDFHEMNLKRLPLK